MTLLESTRTALRLAARIGALAATGAAVRPASQVIASPRRLALGSPAAICDNASILTGPAHAPSGAITVPAGDDSTMLQSPHRRRPIGSPPARTR